MCLALVLLSSKNASWMRRVHSAYSGEATGGSRGIASRGSLVTYCARSLLDTVCDNSPASLSSRCKVFAFQICRSIRRHQISQSKRIKQSTVFSILQIAPNKLQGSN